MGESKIAENRKEVDEALFRRAFLATGYRYGLPSRQLWLTGDYIVKLVTGEITSDEFEGLMIYRALVTGAPEE